MSEPIPSPEKPLAAARARLEAKVRKPGKVSPDLVIGMKAAGVPQSTIADALGVAKQTVTSALDTVPDSRERIADLRDKLKLVKIQRAHQVEGKMWARLEKEVDTGDARDVDAMARALLASEKIQAGVSGEGAASGALQPAPAAQDIKILIQQLLS